MIDIDAIKARIEKLTAERITCQRCGNANPPDATKCLACGCIMIMTPPPFVASRGLSDVDFAHFARAIRNEMDRARRGINAARRAREAADESAASWLWSLNRTKQYALKHGIDLDD